MTRSPLAAAKQPGPADRIAFAVALGYIFLLHSRVFDWFLANLHIPGIVLGVSLALALFLGGFRRAFSNRIGLLLLGVTAWMCLAIPFSVWRSGSMQEVTGAWTRSLGVYIIIAGLTLNYEHCRRMVAAIAWAVFALSILALFTGHMEAGRLLLPSGKFGNPNDLAQVLLIGLPMWFAIAVDPRSSSLKRVMAVVASVLILGNLARTGSRGGMVTFVVLTGAMLLRASMGQRILVLAALMGLSLAAVFLMPQELRQRYLTFRASVETEESDQAPSEELASMDERAVGSTESRLLLLKDSVILTVMHPVLGVGPGQFEVAQNELAVGRGRKGQWQPTHNTFTEWSSESGLPALLMIVAVIVYAWRAVSLPKLREAAAQRFADVTNTALALKMALLAYVVSAMFSSTAYQSHLPTLVALAVAFSRGVGPRLAAEAAREPVRAADGTSASTFRERRRVIPVSESKRVSHIGLTTR